MAFLRNAWYMAGWASELEPGSLLARTICDDPIVLYRDATGLVAALEDRCCHRHYPLSAAGEVIGANLQCGYHGFQYDGSGRCVNAHGSGVRQLSTASAAARRAASDDGPPASAVAYAWSDVRIASSTQG